MCTNIQASVSPNQWNLWTIFVIWTKPPTNPLMTFTYPSFHLHGSKMNIWMIQWTWVVVKGLLDTYLNYTWSIPMKSFATLWDGSMLVQSKPYTKCVHYIQFKGFSFLYLLWLCNILNILSNYSLVTFKQTSLWVLWMMSIKITTFEKNLYN